MDNKMSDVNKYSKEQKAHLKTEFFNKASLGTA